MLQHINLDHVYMLHVNLTAQDTEEAGLEKFRRMKQTQEVNGRI